MKDKGAKFVKINNDCSRVGNAIRLSKNLVKKLSTLKEIEYGN